MATWDNSDIVYEPGTKEARKQSQPCTAVVTNSDCRILGELGDLEEKLVSCKK